MFIICVYTFKDTWFYSKKIQICISMVTTFIKLPCTVVYKKTYRSGVHLYMFLFHLIHVYLFSYLPFYFLIVIYDRFMLNKYSCKLSFFFQSVYYVSGKSNLGKIFLHQKIEVDCIICC